MPEPAVVLGLPPPSEHDRVANMTTQILRPQNNLNPFIIISSIKMVRICMLIEKCSAKDVPLTDKHVNVFSMGYNCGLRIFQA
jgi:hypothetical protein